MYFFLLRKRSNPKPADPLSSTPEQRLGQYRNCLLEIRVALIKGMKKVSTFQRHLTPLSDHLMAISSLGHKVAHLRNKPSLSRHPLASHSEPPFTDRHHLDKIPEMLEFRGQVVTAHHLNVVNCFELLGLGFLDCRLEKGHSGLGVLAGQRVLV
jgi:hypothetical protein